MSVRRIAANIATGEIAPVRGVCHTMFGFGPAIDNGWIVALAPPGTRTVKIDIAVEGGSDTPVPYLSIEIDDLDAKLTRAEAGLHLPVHSPADEPSGVRRFSLRDPSGRPVDVLSRDR